MVCCAAVAAGVAAAAASTVKAKAQGGVEEAPVADRRGAVACEEDVMRVVVQRRTGRSVAERHASSPDGELHGLEKRKMVEEGASGKGGESENCVDKDRGAESKAGVVELTVPDPSSFSLSVTKLMSEDETDTVACRCANAKRKTLQHSPPLLWHRSANATTAPRFLTHVLRSENAARWRGRPSRSLELQDKAKTTGGSTLQTPEFFFLLFPHNSIIQSLWKWQLRLPRTS